MAKKNSKSVHLTNTDIKTIYYQKTFDKPLQIKLHIPNLYLWVSKKGRCTFRFKYYRLGVFTWVTLGDHPTLAVSAAVEKATQMQQKRNAGTNPNVEKRELASKELLFSDFIDKQIEIINKQNLLAKNTIENTLIAYRIIREKLGSYKLHELTTTIIQTKLIKSCVDQDKLAMANRYRIKVKQLLDNAVKKELIIKNLVLLQSCPISRTLAKSRFSFACGLIAAQSAALCG